MSDNLSVCRPGSDCDALVSVSEMLKYKRHDISLINSCFIIIIVINDNTATEPCMLSVARKQNGDEKCLGEHFLRKTCLERRCRCMDRGEVALKS